MPEQALEGLFNPQQTVAPLLETIKNNIRERYTTREQLVELSDKLSKEAVKFNECLTTISNAMRKCEQGEISKEDAIIECSPAVKCLKEHCTCLSLCGTNFPEGDITEEEIAMINELLTGSKSFVDSMLSDADNSAFESLINDLDDVATEGFGNLKIAMQISSSTDMKTADAYYAQARRLYGMGDKEKAKSYLSKAKKLYEKLLDLAKKNAKMKSVERTIETRAGSTKTADTYTKDMTDSVTLAAVIKKLEEKLSSCEATLLQWDNKAGTSSYKDTKKSLSLERAKRGAYNRATKSARSEAEKYAKAKLREDAKAGDVAEESILDTIYACEAMLNDIDLEDQIAIEAEGSSDGGEDPRIQRIKELAYQAKAAAKSGDTATISKCEKEMNKLVDEIGREAANAYTEEDQKVARRKAIKIGAITAATIGTVGVVAYGAKKTDAVGKIANFVKNTTAKLKEMHDNGTAKPSDTKNALNTTKRSISGFFSGLISGIKKKKQAEDSAASESFVDDSIFDFCSAMESVMDELEDELSEVIANESSTDYEYAAAMEAGSIGAKLRAAFGKLRRGGKTGDSEEVQDAVEEIQDAADELQDAAAEAETPEEKEKLSKAAKIGLAAGAAAIAAIGGVMIKKGIDKNRLKKMNATAAQAGDMSESSGAVDAVKAAPVLVRIAKTGGGALLGLPAGSGDTYVAPDDRRKDVSEKSRDGVAAYGDKVRRDAAKSARVEKFNKNVDKYKANGKSGSAGSAFYDAVHGDRSDAAFAAADALDEENAKKIRERAKNTRDRVEKQRADAKKKQAERAAKYRATESYDDDEAYLDEEAYEALLGDMLDLTDGAHESDVTLFGDELK